VLEIKNPYAKGVARKEVECALDHFFESICLDDQALDLENDGGDPSELLKRAEREHVRGFFYTEFTGGDEAAWKRYTIKADECPRISPEFLDEEKRALGAYWYAQEYECAWHENESALFRADVIRRAVRDDVEELDLDLDLGRSELAPTYHGEAYDIKLDLKPDLSKIERYF
jgi:hypothetical protein